MRKSKLFSLELLSLLMLTMFMSLYSFAAFTQTAVPPVVLAPSDFFAQVLAAIQGFGGLSTMLKISTVIMLIIASMKVSFLNTNVWSKLGSAQVWVAPVLGLIGGALSLGTGATPVSAASIFAYVTAGAGAVFLHEILDSVKAIPGIGAIYVTIINLVEGALGGPASKA